MEDGIPQMSLECLWVIAEESVDQAEELHDPFILPQILMSFQQEHKVTPIATCTHIHTPHPYQYIINFNSTHRMCKNLILLGERARLKLIVDRLLVDRLSYFSLSMLSQLS